jgi:phosphoribosylglycinamide formyltransferase
MISCDLFSLFVLLLSFVPHSVTKTLQQNAIGRAHAAWKEGKINKTGVMIHKVISEVDMGEPILVKEIPFVKGVDEDLDVFEKKVHEVEWGAVIEGVDIAIREVQEGKSRHCGTA